RGLNALSGSRAATPSMARRESSRQPPQEYLSRAHGKYEGVVYDHLQRPQHLRSLSSSARLTHCKRISCHTNANRVARVRRCKFPRLQPNELSAGCRNAVTRTAQPLVEGLSTSDVSSVPEVDISI